jgi:hypothetical protein
MLTTIFAEYECKRQSYREKFTCFPLFPYNFARFLVLSLWREEGERTTIQTCPDLTPYYRLPVYVTPPAI